MNLKWQKYIKQLEAQHRLRTNFISQADRLLKNEFLFDNEYAMEATQVTYKMDPITWNETPNGDPEWLFMLKRQEYLFDLLGAYYLTGETKYRDRMKTFIFEWIDNNSNDESTWRTIDTGIRLLNWTSAVAALAEEGQLSTAEHDRITASVKQQAEYLQNQYIEKYDISNWGVLITTGVLTYAARFKDAIPQDIVDWAQARLDQELDLQVDDEGMQWEQSPLYQLEVWRSTLAVVAAQQANDVPVSPTVMRKMQLLHQAIPHYIKPKGTLVQQGDTDEIRIDSLYNASAAVLHLANPLKDQLSPEYDFLLLELAHEEWQPTNAVTSELSVYMDGHASGNYMWRSDWREDADYWHVYSGALGSGHGHASLGHMDLAIAGRDVLVDPGRYTYVDGTERRFLKSAAAHNTIELDHKAFTVPKDSWKFAYAGVPLASQRIHFDGGDVIQSQYLDRSGASDALVTRYWISLPAEHVYLSVDVIRDAGHHAVTRHFQIAPLLDAVMADGGVALGSDYALTSTVDETVLAQTLFAPHYNDLAHLSRVSLLNTFDDVDVQATVITTADNSPKLTRVVPHQSGETQAAKTALAWGARLDLKDGRNLLVTLETENTIVGRKLYWYDGTEAYGTMNLFLRHGEEVIKHMRVL